MFACRGRPPTQFLFTTGDQTLASEEASYNASRTCYKILTNLRGLQDNSVRAHEVS